MAERHGASGAGRSERPAAGSRGAAAAGSPAEDALPAASAAGGEAPPGSLPADAAPPQPDPFADRLRLLAVRPEPMSGASAALHDRLAHLVRLQFGGRFGTMFQPAGTGDIALLIPASGTDDGSAEEAKRLGEELAAAARRFLNLAVAGGVSGAFSGRSGLAGAYREAAASLERCFYDARPGIHVYTPRGIQREGAPLLTPEDERQLRAAVRQMHAAGAKDLLQLLFDRILEWAGPVEQFMPWCLRLLHTIQQALEPHHAGMLEPLERELPLYKQVLGFRHVSEARDWFGQLIDYGCGQGEIVVPGSFRDEIRQLIGYVNVHYAEELSLRRAASMVAMSENYLSSLFKKETRVGFTDYVNGIRIEKAAELLAGTRLPVYQIAEKVGFGNFNYFGRLFKKIKGESPQQYRSKYLCGGMPRTV
ncbi:helix-turn-helix domain-containing protein [Paenibacillus sp. 1P03SA]|uniref:helix-turn-helix domain-containing protein n=1 Tax=Paenibacillus sp. 1P03SA TaxID=3132294 RepID=UPI00399F2F14